MNTAFKTLTVSRAAQMCGVGRTTVGYWIRSGKLSARRHRRNYSIVVDDLLYFLKNSGHPIPESLVRQGGQGPIYGRYRRCWEYRKEHGEGDSCENCIVAEQKITDCFTLSSNQIPGHRKTCHKCNYYRDLVAVRIEFIHQLELPAVVFKNFSIWGGNRLFSQLCDLGPEKLIGLGIERLVHPDSLAEVIASLKQLTLGRAPFVNPCRVAVLNAQQVKMDIEITVLPLNDPPETWLSLVTDH